MLKMTVVPLLLLGKNIECYFCDCNLDVIKVDKNHTINYSSNIRCKQFSCVHVQVEERKEAYVSSYDIVLVKDETLDVPNAVLKYITSSEELSSSD